MEEADEMDMLQERISPCDFTGERREQYMREVWEAFLSYARRGRLTLFDAKRVAEQLRVDGEEATLDAAVPIADRQNISFQRLVELLDEMSRSATDEYRELDGERQDASDSDVIELGPLDYLRFRCGGSVDGVSAADEASSPHGSASSLSNRNVRLSMFKLFSTNPRVALLPITVALILASAIVVAGAIAGVWWQSATEDIRQATIFRADFYRAAAEEMEVSLLTGHAQGILATTDAIADWVTNMAMIEEKSRQASVAVVASIAKDVLLESTKTLGSDELENDILDDLVESGALDAAAFVSTAPYYRSQAWNATFLEVRSEDDCLALDPLAVSFLLNGIHYCHKLVTEVPTAATVDFARNYINGLPDNWVYAALTNCTAFSTSQTCNVNPSKEERDASSFLLVRQRLVTSSDGSDKLVLSMDVPREGVREHERQKAIAVANHLNFAFVRTTEIVVARKNADGEFIPQATLFRFADTCHSNDCYRSAAAIANLANSVKPGARGWKITPDYRPEPVVGGYTGTDSNLRMGIVLERDVIEIRGITMTAVVDVIDDINAGRGAAGPNPWISVFTFADTPFMPLFDAYQPCPPLTECLSDRNGSEGIIFQYSCSHCQRMSQLPFGKALREVTQQMVACDVNAGCGYPVDAIRRSLVGGSDDALDSAVNGTSHFWVLRYVANYTAVIAVRFRYAQQTQPLLDVLAIALPSIAAATVVLLLFHCVVANTAMRTVERQEQELVQSLSASAATFTRALSRCVPRQISDRVIDAKTETIAEQHTTVGFVFVDVCGFSDIIKAWSSKQIGRYAAYLDFLIDTIAAEAQVVRIRTIGDLSVVLALRDDGRSSSTSHPGGAPVGPDAAAAAGGTDLTSKNTLASGPLAHPATRAMQFAALLTLIFSPLFELRPYTVKLFRSLFKDLLRTRTIWTPPQVRLGVHCGPAVWAASPQPGGGTLFDVYGAGPALANRMQQTSQPSRIHVTTMVKDMLRTRDPEGKFKFEAPRKTVVRGHGTITSFFVRSICEPVPRSLLVGTGIEHARLRLAFITEAKKINDGASALSGNR